MSAQDNAALVRGGYEAFGKGDVPAVVAALADDVVWHIPVAAPCPATTEVATRCSVSCGGGRALLRSHRGSRSGVDASSAEGTRAGVNLRVGDRVEHRELVGARDHVALPTAPQPNPDRRPGLATGPAGEP